MSSPNEHAFRQQSAHEEWCERCKDSVALTDDHRCARCGAVLEHTEHIAAPWHFKLLLVGTAGYLLYRLVWFIFWATGHGWHG